MSHALVPPRPNLGPEPWPEPVLVAWPGFLGAALLVLGVVLILGRRWWRGRAVGPAEVDSGWDEPGLGPRERFVAWSGAARSALAARFGEGWRAKTTEEIAADPALGEALGPEQAEAFVGLLRAADRAKFAGDPGPSAEGQSALMGTLLSALGTPEAGASSRTSGK